MVYNIVAIDWDSEFVSALQEDKRYFENETTHVFDDYGVIWYEGHDFKNITKYMTKKVAFN